MQLGIQPSMFPQITQESIKTRNMPCYERSNINIQSTGCHDIRLTA